MTVSLEYIMPDQPFKVGATGETSSEAWSQFCDFLEVVRAGAKCGNCGSDAVEPRNWPSQKDGRDITIPKWFCPSCRSNLSLHTRKDGCLYTKHDDEWWVPEKDGKKGGQEPPI
jgi:hypothetical protein